MADTEKSRCDFCGDHDVLCAVSEATQSKVSICGSCVTWADEQLAERPLGPVRHNADNGECG